MRRHVPGDGVLARQDRYPVITVIGEAMVKLMPAPDSSLMQASPGRQRLHHSDLGRPAWLPDRADGSAIP